MAGAASRGIAALRFVTTIRRRIGATTWASVSLYHLLSEAVSHPNFPVSKKEEKRKKEVIVIERYFC